MTIYAHWEEATNYPAATDRYLIAALLRQTAPVTPRAGVIRSDDGTDLQVTAQATPDMTVEINAGPCVIPASAGAYIGTSTESETRTIGTADGTNPRIDLIVFQILDEEEGDGDSEGEINVIAGEPDPAPSPPTVPDRALVLAEVLVDAGVSSIVSGKITDRRTYTAAAGGAVQPPYIQTFTSSGIWTRPDGLKAVRVRGVSGGGSSGGCGTGSGQAASGAAGGGAYFEKIILAEDLGATETVTVGAGGAAPAAGGNAGNQGGSSSFGSHCSATGGGGGDPMTCTTGSAYAAGGPGGTATGGDINISGGHGAGGIALGGIAISTAFGGNSQLSGVTGQSVAGQLYGGGAGGVGAVNSDAAGLVGAGGIVIVEHIF